MIAIVSSELQSNKILISETRVKTLFRSHKFGKVIKRTGQVASKKSFLAGEEIYRAGQSSNGAFIIDSGTVSLFTSMNFHLVTLGEGELFGELGQIVDEQRSVTAISKTDCELRYIPRNVLDEKFENTDPAITGMFRAMAIRLRKANEQKVEMWTEIESLRASRNHLELEMAKMKRALKN